VAVLLALFAFLSYARSQLPDVPITLWINKEVQPQSHLRYSLRHHGFVSFHAARGQRARIESAHRRLCWMHQVFMSILLTLLAMIESLIAKFELTPDDERKIHLVRPFAVNPEESSGVFTMRARSSVES
jgi:hypothetical protein